MSRNNLSPRGGSGILLGRGIWLLATAAVLLAQLPSLRARFSQVNQACAEPNCTTGQLTVQAMRALHALGLPLDAFAVWDDILLLISVAVFCLIGGVIIWRRGTDRIGILAGFTLVLFGGVTFPLGTPLDVLHLEGSLWGPVVDVLALAGSVGIGLFLYLFPDGRFAPRWMTVLGASWVLLQCPAYLAPGSPFDAQDGSSNSILGIVWVAFVMSMVGSQIYRYRAVSGPVERQQTKWVVLGVTVALLSFLTMIAAAATIPAISHTGLVWLFAQSLFRFVMLPIPIAIGFAMLRYRLWDVDLLVNRALVYASLTLSIVGLYIGGVIVLQSLFRAVTGQHSDLAVAIATLGIAALFNPWRHRLQSFIDRRFYRRRYDATRILATFSGRLRDEVDLDHLTADLVAVAHETMQPAHVALWLPEAAP